MQGHSSNQPVAAERIKLNYESGSRKLLNTPKKIVFQIKLTVKLVLT